MTAPRISVVVPVFDGARFVAEAVASVRTQTTPAWELVVVDDGSTDDSASCVARERDSRVRLLRQENAGVLAARAAGIAAARGESVVLLDADDRLRPDALERFGEALDRAPEADVVYGDRVLADAEGRVIGDERGALLCPRPEGDVLERLLSRNFISTPGQACIRARALADASEWPADLRRMGDWYAWCRIATRGAFRYVGRGPVVEYRLHRDGLSRRFTAGACLPPAIDELLPAIDAVFALPGVVGRFPERRRRALRRRCEASAYAWKAQELLRAALFRESRAYLLRALRRHPAAPVDLLCLALALVGFFPPGVRRWIGQVAAEPAWPSLASRRTM